MDRVLLLGQFFPVAAHRYWIPREGGCEASIVDIVWNNLHDCSVRFIVEPFGVYDGQAGTDHVISCGKGKKLKSKQYDIFALLETHPKILIGPRCAERDQKTVEG